MLTAVQISYGFSRFCDLFTYEEWIGFSYAIDLVFAGNAGFHNPTGVSVFLHLRVPSQSCANSILTASRWYRVPAGSHRPAEKPHPWLLGVTDQRDARQQHRHFPSQPKLIPRLLPRYQHRLRLDGLWLASILAAASPHRVPWPSQFHRVACYPLRRPPRH